jgi:cytochrome c oxidase cbb3-type subunit 4
MYMDILRSVAGIQIFPVVSLALFVAVFSVVLVRVCRADRSHMDRMAALPLDEPTSSGPRA